MNTLRSCIALLVFAGCSGGAASEPETHTLPELPAPADELEAGLPPVYRDAGPGDVTSDARPAPGEASPTTGPAPAQPGEVIVVSGDTPLDIPKGGTARVRVDAKKGEHIGFLLTFASSSAKVDLTVERWNGSAVESMYTTNGGLGVRALATYHATEDVTYWAKIKPTEAFTGSLEVTRTPFVDGAQCQTDCDRLLQLPIPNDANKDGYAFTSGTLVRYQFGRRDLVMFVRYAGKNMVAHGRQPFYPHDFSQWDGKTPGTDTGSLRHVSHQRGKDVDISLYGEDGSAKWRSYCDTTSTSKGTECIAGTAKGLGTVATAGLIGSLYESGRVTMMFLDKELITLVKPKAPEAQSEGFFSSKYTPYFGDGKHLQHWPYHDDHVHVRVSEDSYNKFYVGGDTHADDFAAP